MMGLRESRRLHGVLLGHEYRQFVAKGEVFPSVGIVIGKWMLDDVEALGAKSIEKPLRVADSGNRMHRPAKGGHVHGIALTVHPPQGLGDEFEGCLRLGAAVEEHEIDVLEP